MVLPDRIELSTSPLPMECSTTELRQRAPDTGLGQKGPYKAADPCHKAPSRASVGRGPGTSFKNGHNSAWSRRGFLQPAELRADPVPHFLAQRRQRLDGADHDLEFDHFARFIEPDEIDALELPFADIGGKFQRDIVRAGDEGAVIAKILEDLYHRGQHQQGRGAPGNWRLHEWRVKHNMFGQ